MFNENVCYSILFFQNAFRYKRAAWWFEKTLAHIPSSLSEMWEPTVVNLAHALRKLRYVYYSFPKFCLLL